MKMSSSSKIMVALLFAFALVVAPSAASRVQGFKPAAAAENRDEAPAAEQLLHPTAAGTTPALPGLPGLFPQLPGGLPGLSQPFPGGIGGLIAGILFPPLIPLLPLLPSAGGPTTTTTTAPQATAPQPTECMTPLLNMMPCTDYLTNVTVLTPPGQCCDGLKSVISSAPICLCHAINRDLNSQLPKPIDPVRALVLPLACGTMLPLQTLFACSSSSQVPPIFPAQPPTATPSPSP